MSFVETSGERPTDAELAAVRDDVAEAGADIITAAGAGDAAAALDALARHRVMVAHRRGPFGVGSVVPPGGAVGPGGDERA